MALPPDASSSNPAFDPADAIDFWDDTNREDWRVSELSQRGIASRGYRPGLYSPREGLLWEFDRIVRRAARRVSQDRQSCAVLTSAGNSDGCAIRVIRAFRLELLALERPPQHGDRTHAGGAARDDVVRAVADVDDL